MNQRVDLKIAQEGVKAIGFYQPTEKFAENVEAIIHQQNYNIAYLQEIGTDLEVQFRELNNKISGLQKTIEKMKEGENHEINEESLAQNVASKIIINSPPLPMGESRLRFSEPKLLKWKTEKSSTKREMKMLSRILSKRSTAPVQLINAQEFEYNEIESSVREASAPRFRFNEIYKKGSFLMDSHRFKILELTVPATGGETDIRDAAHCLRLRIKTDGISMKKGMMELAIDYRIYYKLMSSNVTPNTRFLNSPGITTSVLTNPKNNSQQKHVTKWHEVTFPREWNLTPPVRQLESSNASVYEDTGGKISLQFHRHSFANYEEASTSEIKAVYKEESLEEEDTKRPMRMFQVENLKELYAQAEICDSIEELEKIMKIISQVQIGKKKRKILPYQAAKEEPEPSGASMDTDGERQNPLEGGHTVIQNITNNPTKIIREKNIKLPKGQAPTGKYGERSSQKYIPTEPKWGQSVSKRGVYLDLDQVGDKRKTIDNWVASLKLTQALVLSKYAYEEAHAYYESTLTGIVQKWYQSFKRSSQWTDWAAKMAQTNSPLDFAVPIYAQFCGDITGHSEQSKERAKANIQKLSICNMRYFEEYTNEFQNYYCTIGDIENNDLIRTYYRKLPEPWNDAVAQSLEENPLQYFTVGGIAERVRDLLRKQCTENRKSKTAKKQLRGVENMCPKILDTPTQWGCHMQERKYKKRFSGNKQNKNFASKKKYKFRRKPEYKKEQSSQTSSRKRFFKRKKKTNFSSREEKKCRCWLCKAEGHYANECPKKDKRSSKALIAEYDEAIEYANIKGFEVAYSDEENESIYSLEYPSDSETESASENSEEDEEEIGQRPIFVLQIQNWKEENSDIISTFHPNPGRFICDYCKCDDNNTIPMYCENTGETYHRECFIAELRRKTKDNEAHILVEEEYNVFHKKEQEKKMEEEMKTMKFVTSLSQNKEIKESLDSLNSSSNPILGLANDNPVDSLTTGRKINPFTELFNTPTRKERIMPVQTSIYSNYITIGLKFPNYKKYHLHAFVDTGSGYSLAKRHAIPEEYWEKSPKPVTGVAMEENKIVMNTMARNVKVSLGGGNFIIKILWQCEGQTADLLLGNDFLLQQTVTQTSKMIGFEKNHRFYWESRLTDAVSVTNKGFTEQYQKLPAKSGDYKPVLNPVLLLQKQLEDYEEILVNEATSSEDSESEKNSEYQNSDNESSDGEEDYIREHNLKVYANKVEQKKIPTLREIENLLKPIISEDPQLYWEKDPIYCQLRMHDANAICHVKAIPHYRKEDRKEMENQIQELLEKKLIRPSNSPHHAPAFLVRNHAEQLRGKARMVIDYRDVNKKTVKDGYQIAQVRVLINRLKGAKIFSKFDAKSGFWQVKMHPDSIALTAFGTPQGHYEWLVMPFGLKQAPSIFQRKMDNIFKPYSDFCIVYIDDILVFSKTMNEHLKHLEQVCKLIVQKGIILGQKKIHLIKGEIDFLGIHVKDGEIRLQDHIVKKISQFQDNIPDAKSLQRFLGVVNFARDFIPQVSGLTALLSPKTSSKKKWSFTEDDSNTVRKIKELTKTLPPLLLPEEGDLIILQTDANDYYWAGVVLAIAPNTNQEKICKFLSGKFNAAELNYSTGDKEVLALIKSIKGAEAFLGNKFVVRTDNKRVKNFKNYKLTDAADRGRVLRWQMFLSQYDYDVEMVVGDKNYLPDALTREMATFEREGRNQRSRKPVSEEKKLWERYKNGDKTVGPLHDGPGYQYIVSYGAAESSQPPERIKPKLNQKWDDLSGHSKKDADQSITDDEERITKEFLMCPKGTALTDRSQGKRPASPSQTADGKGISSPLMAAALPKSRRDPLRANKLPLVTGKKVIHDQPLKIFQKPVFRTERLLAFKQKIIIDNILYSFYEENEAHLLQTLKALTEEMYGFHAKGKSVLAEPSKVVYLENPESTRIPILALKESEWYSFHNLLGERKDVLPGTLSIVPGPYYGRYLVDVQAEHPQKHKLWLIENGFVHNLWTKTNDDMKGFPKIITEAVINIRPDGCILRLKFISTPPEWTVVEGQTNYISPYHHVRIIQSPVRTSIAISGNGRPNQSIPWMKAMTIAVIKDIVLRDYDSSLLASGEKIMVTCYNHPPPENCDFFTALMRKEVDCTLATTTWLEKVETEEKYKVSYPYDSDLDNEDEDTAREWENNGPNSSAGYSEDPETYHNIVNMMEK
ncbi:hypothetical protein ACLB2K_040722 [Fragaria x ananassa]